MKLTIKPATPGQAQLIADILNDGTQFKRQQNDTGWGTFSYEGGLRMATSGNTYIAYLNDKPVGTVALEWEDDGWEKFDPNAAYIHRLSIKQGYHGQRLGEQILLWAAQAAKGQGRTYLRLDCSLANKKLCHYYEQRGFVKVDQQYFADYNYTANLYQREVK